MEPTTHFHHFVMPPSRHERPALHPKGDGFLVIFEGVMKKFEAELDVPNSGGVLENGLDEIAQVDTDTADESLAKATPRAEEESTERVDADSEVDPLPEGARQVEEGSSKALFPVSHQQRDPTEMAPRKSVNEGQLEDEPDSFVWPLQQRAPSGREVGDEALGREKLAAVDPPHSTSPLGRAKHEIKESGEFVSNQTPHSAKQSHPLAESVGKEERPNVLETREPTKAHVVASSSTHAAHDALTRSKLSKTPQHEAQANAQERGAEKADMNRPAAEPGVRGGAQAVTTHFTAPITREPQVISTDAGLLRSVVDHEVPRSMPIAVGVKHAPNVVAKMTRPLLADQTIGSDQKMQELPSSSTLDRGAVPSERLPIALKLDQQSPRTPVVFGPPQTVSANVPLVQDEARALASITGVTKEAVKTPFFAPDIEFALVPPVRSHEAGGGFAVSESPRAMASGASIELARSVSGQLKAQVSVAASAGFDIALKPVELGNVRLALVADDVGSTLFIQADRVETLDLMRRHIGILEQDLKAMGHDNLSLRFSNGNLSGQTFQNPQHGLFPHQKRQQGIQGQVEQQDGASRPANNLRNSPSVPSDSLDLRL